MSASDVGRFAREWPEQRERWRRFAQWERERLAAAPADLAEAIAWWSDAWELARRHDPEWASTPRVLERCALHTGVQRALARANLTA